MLLKQGHSILFFLVSVIFCYGSYMPDSIVNSDLLQDTLQDKQFLYNGRLWKNMYTGVRGHPYFLMGDFINSSVHFNGKKYHNLKVKYDIFADEIILFINPHIIIFLNKEMVKELTFTYNGQQYNIENVGGDTSGLINGYVNILYEGSSSFFVKFKKEIQPLAEENRYDSFYQTHRMYISRDSSLMPFTGRKSLLKIMCDRKEEIRGFIKKKRLTLTRKDPYSFIPVIEYYDNLRIKDPVIK